MNVLLLRHMEWVLVGIALIAAVVVGGAVAWVVARRAAAAHTQLFEHLEVVKTSLSALQGSLQENTRTMFSAFESQMRQTTEVIRATQESLTRQLKEVSETTGSTNEKIARVMELQTALKNLERTLTNQKQRGALGERSLQLVLENILPPTAFALQHTIAPGLIADAAIFVKEGVIPIDAKFSLDDFQRAMDASDEGERERALKAHYEALKQRINETAKYILPQKGTLPFAIMYIPSEAIYYDLLSGTVGAETLVSYAHNKRVIIASPTTFTAYLQTVYDGLRAWQIEKNAQEILKNVEKLQRHLKAYEVSYHKVGLTLTTAVNHYNASAKEWLKIDKDIARLNSSKEAPQLESLAITERPLSPVAELNEQEEGAQK